jgi:hypothetical protein
VRQGLEQAQAFGTHAAILCPRWHSASVFEWPCAVLDAARLKGDLPMRGKPRRISKPRCFSQGRAGPSMPK